jgi:hypothetical protein
MARRKPITAAEYAYNILLQPEPEGGYKGHLSLAARARDLRGDARRGPRDGCGCDRGLPEVPR